MKGSFIEWIDHPGLTDWSFNPVANAEMPSRVLKCSYSNTSPLRRIPMSTCLRAAIAFLFLVILIFPLLAQAPSGEISGVVTDAAGSVVVGVKVTITNAATNAVREVMTNESGLYAIPALPPGIYTLKVEKPGFRAIERRNIEVLVGSANRIDVALE